MDQLTRIFWDICRFKSGPQDLPPSSFLAALTVITYFLIEFVVGLASLSMGNALLAAFVEVGLLVVLSYLVLWIRLWTNRWNQTLSALAGTGAMLGILVLPTGLLYQAVKHTNLVVLPSLLMIGLLVWAMVVIAHILRHALEIHMLLAGGLSALYMYISIRIINALFLVPK